jgi:hypothetical protein
MQKFLLQIDFSVLNMVSVVWGKYNKTFYVRKL